MQGGARPTLHLLVGYVGAGKTTAAKRIAGECRAVRFTLDEWMRALFDLVPSDDEYGAQAERVKDLIWEVAAQVLRQGGDVVLDWSQWSRQRRARWRDRALEVGARPLFHYVDVPLEVAVERISRRNAAPGPGAHVIDVEEMRRFSETSFEAPSAEEGITIVVEAG